MKRKTAVLMVIVALLMFAPMLNVLSLPDEVSILEKPQGLIDAPTGMVYLRFEAMLTGSECRAAVSSILLEGWKYCGYMAYADGVPVIFSEVVEVDGLTLSNDSLPLSIANLSVTIILRMKPQAGDYELNGCITLVAGQLLVFDTWSAIVTTHPTRTGIWNRVVQITLEWLTATPEEKALLWDEAVWLVLVWPAAEA